MKDECRCVNCNEIFFIDKTIEIDNVKNWGFCSDYCYNIYGVEAGIENEE